MKCFVNYWKTLSLKYKLGFYTVMVISIMIVSVLFNIRVSRFTTQSFEEILDDNSRCYDFQEALEMEIKAFEAYVRNRTRETQEEYELSIVRTERCVRALPFDFRQVGKERYARTWNVKNGYENYCIARDEVFVLKEKDQDFVPRLYQVYNMQSYLQVYARRLVQSTLRDESRKYQDRISVLHYVPYLVVLFSVIMILIAGYLSRILSYALIHPLEKLVNASRKIAKNDFSGNDLEVDNEDEMGEMIRAFNKMKHATEGYINTLKKNNEMAELLHKEELERIEMEKRLDAARLEILKSQINPHFLFNTLNMIACMAKLEDAATTEKMISCMSNLFRYNLKTSEQIVPLEQELKVVRDYVYLQQMRFGDRIRFEEKIAVDAHRVKILAFTLQPLVENAIIHGLSKKEQGGRIRLKVWKRGQNVIISVSDTGLGMTQEKLKSLKAALGGQRTARVGIGLGNIYHRIHTMYGEDSFWIYSREGRGTVIQMRIPQETAW